MAITQSENPARLAWPAKDGPETMAMVGTQPESSAIPSKSMKRPEGPVQLEVALPGAGMPGSTAPAVDEDHHRPPVLVGQRKQSLQPTGPVAATLVGEVGRGADDGEPVDGADNVDAARLGHPSSIGRQRRNRSVGHFGVGVEEGGHTLPRRQPARSVNGGDRLGAGVVQL